MRVFALSDIHTDFPDNMRWIRDLSSSDYTEDALILAGDIAHHPAVLERTFDILLPKYARICFVPGNHDLWVRESDGINSLTRFEDVLATCSSMGICSSPIRAGGSRRGTWIVPLFSWYTRPEGGSDSLCLEKRGEDPTLEAWSDNHFIRWPDLGDANNPTEYFLRLNQPSLGRDYDAPIISFSHFLPRADLIRAAGNEKRRPDPYEGFNFSRVAGSKLLDDQIRELGSVIHVYGHQHRNRDRVHNDVRYVSYCLGYAQERLMGYLPNVTDEPMVVWDSESESETDNLDGGDAHHCA